MRNWTRGATVAACIVATVGAGFGLAAVVGGDRPGSRGQQAPRDETTVKAVGQAEPPGSRHSAAAATAEEPLEEPPVGPLDWDGGRWDVGNVVSIRGDGDRLVVVLDRYQMYQSDSGSTGYALRAGKRLIRDPFVFGNSDTPFVNESAKLHSYVLAADAQVQWISNVDEVCTSLQGNEDTDGASAVRQKPAPQFERWDVDRLVADSLGTEDLNGSGARYDGRQDVLTFNDHGQVRRLVFSRGC